MKTPGFIEGVGVALIIAVSGAALFGVLPWFVGAGLAGLLTSAVLSLSYLLYLLHRAPQKTGRATLLALWLSSSLAVWIFDIGMADFLLLQLGFIWLARMLYFRPGAFAALADLGLLALAATAALWAFGRSGSVLLALWSYFLVEALFPLLPFAKASAADAGLEPGGVNPRFEQAHRTALAALQRLSTDQSTG